MVVRCCPLPLKLVSEAEEMCGYRSRHARCCHRVTLFPLSPSASTPSSASCSSSSTTLKNRTLHLCVVIDTKDGTVFTGFVWEKFFLVPGQGFVSRSQLPAERPYHREPRQGETPLIHKRRTILVSDS